MSELITVTAVVNAPLETVWAAWTMPEHIIRWNAASPDWHTPHAENDLQVGGKFNYRMEAKDGSFGFDFWGIYHTITLHKEIASTLGDGRALTVLFIKQNGGTRVTEVFEAETQNSIELQRAGWQAILDNFKRHTESLA